GMEIGVVLLNFGEPAEPERERVVEYLTRIFLNNAELDGADTEAERQARSRQLAERRAPGLIEEYETIGGSPLNEQSEAQRVGLQKTLADRGYDVTTYLGFQFVEPTIEDVVHEAHADGIEHLIGLPIYPLCGPSTTVDALEDMAAAVEGIDDWDPDVDEVTGWHRHPTYNRIRAEAIATTANQAGVDLQAPETELVLSAHGTPRHYLDEGSRYDVYVEEFSEALTGMLDVEEYTVGFQNHANRDIAWTEPEIEHAIETVDAERVVVDPISFMHEQSETLSELDEELREAAEAEALEFHRVPVPHDDDRFPDVLADLVEPFIADFDAGYYQFRPCQCRDDPNAMCLNAPRPN
ncbi:MAG: ferrochelatase, partial [Halobacteriales archaeon]